MRLISFAHDGKRRIGAVINESVIDLTSRDPRFNVSLRTALERDLVADMREIAETSDTDFTLRDIELLVPITDPEKIICIGVNYVNRNAEYRDGSDLPEYPSVFLRTRESLVAHGAPLLRPPESEQLDYEGEIAIIIGKHGRRISIEDAPAHIAGLSLINEGSIRDWLRHAKFNVTQGKNFACSGAFGPWLVTADELPDGYEDLTISTHVNGEQRQHDTTRNLLFPFTYLISYLSTFMPLNPGDVISTGTPNGAGARFDPPKYLKPGDVVEVQSPSLGTLSNRVEDEAV